MTRAGSGRPAAAGPVRRLAMLALAMALASGCGPSRQPSWLADVEAISSGQAMAGVMAKAPGEWKAAADALDGARKALKGGDEASARILAARASILFKTAMAVARGIDAKARVQAAEERISAADAAAGKFRSERLDAESRFLSLKSFHEAEGDLAKQKLASLEKDKKAVAAMSAAQKEKWMSLEDVRCGREIQRCRATLLAADALGCGGYLAAESGDAAASLAKAEAAAATPWESRRILVDDAALRADRLLEHCRALHEPAPIANPAGDPAILDTFVKAMVGTGAMVSASPRGIVVALADPSDGKGGLSAAAAEAIGMAAGVAGKMAPATLLVEAYPPLGCAGEGCAEEAGKAADLGAAAIGAAAGLSITAHGWGAVQPAEPGPCLAAACPGGRLDIVILSVK